ncbi:hypothetical protein E2320_007391 [Naja naja]|nr:hypothetical protein E2320_007391 [Naja naja]
MASVQEMGRAFVESGLCPENTSYPFGSLPLSERQVSFFRSGLQEGIELLQKGLPTMEGATLFSHLLWFICSLALLALLWVQRTKSWRPDACPVDLTGKTAIVTGASSGIGKAVALDLARRNARTILACRCREKGRAVVEEIRRATGNPQVQLSLLDVSSMASVRAFARRFLEEGSQLHILVNNAGVTGLPFAVTAEGLELTFATNVSGAFLLTHLLLGVSANVVSPGIVRTEILRYYGRASRLLYWLCSAFMRVSQAARQQQLQQQVLLAPKGAISTLYCAVAPEVKGISGKYFDSNCTLVLPQALAQDPALGQRLWDALEKATGLKMDRSQQAVSGPLPRGRSGASPSFMAGGAEKLLLSNMDL